MEGGTYSAGAARAAGAVAGAGTSVAVAGNAVSVHWLRVAMVHRSSYLEWKSKQYVPGRHVNIDRVFERVEADVW